MAATNQTPYHLHLAPRQRRALRRMLSDQEHRQVASAKPLVRSMKVRAVEAANNITKRITKGLRSFRSLFG